MQRRIFRHPRVQVADYTLARNIGASHTRLGCWGALNADDLAAVTARLLPTSAKRLFMAAPAIRPAMASALGFFCRTLRRDQEWLKIGNSWPMHRPLQNLRARPLFSPSGGPWANLWVLSRLFGPSVDLQCANTMGTTK